MRRFLPPVMAAVLLAINGCALLQRKPVAPPPVVHYVVGASYKIGDVWRYPRAEYGVDETGLATFAPSNSGYTADGETFDQTALLAGHRTLQLPAVLLVTNLENGRQIRVRLNDRGPPQPTRLIALSRRAAELLQMTQDGTRVRIQMDDTMTRQLASTFDESAPKIEMEAAPVGTVASESLAPPTGVGQSNRGKVAASGPTVTSSSAGRADPVGLRLPEQVFQVQPHPGMLYIDAGSFSRMDYASILVNKLAYLGARLTTSYTAPRDKAYRIRIGPLFTLPDAEAMLARTIAAGVNDAAIVVE
jgi:rare lipoprotein A